jgi:hypothetical protein
MSLLRGDVAGGIVSAEQFSFGRDGLARWTVTVVGRKLRRGLRRCPGSQIDLRIGSRGALRRRGLVHGR